MVEEASDLSQMKLPPLLEPPVEFASAWGFFFEISSAFAIGIFATKIVILF
jgi:hypothetical protein